MKRAVSLLLCAVLALLTLVPAAMADEAVLVAGKARVQFSLRKTAEADASKFGTADIGADVDILEAIDDTWCRVRVGAYTGYAQWKWLRMPQGVTVASLLETSAPAPTSASTEAPALPAETPAPVASTLIDASAATITSLALDSANAPLNQYSSLTVGDGSSEALQYWGMTRKKAPSGLSLPPPRAGWQASARVTICVFIPMERNGPMWARRTILPAAMCNPPTCSTSAPSIASFMKSPITSSTA